MFEKRKDKSLNVRIIIGNKFEWGAKIKENKEKKKMQRLSEYGKVIRSRCNVINLPIVGFLIR